MELKANELRIGNILLCAERDIPYRVTAEDILVIDDGSSKSRPVPLSEEILLKCGFIKEKIMTSSFSIGKLTIDIGCDKIHPYGRVYFNSWAIIEKKIDYLHQLQNLYFALTNEELTVNL